ncbi:MAG: carboxymuconolactone decarboxylase family protein [Bacteroidota bacterium]|nr:carboxymuconolactone decarboxylase family protein [Bacteroidota bacterium]
MKDHTITWHAHTIETAPEKSKEILAATKKSMGMIPNMHAYMAENPAMIGSYIHGYNLFRNIAGFNAIEQEVIFLSISVANGCEYCVAAHSMVADQMSKVPVEITDAIRGGKSIPDTKLGALSTFTQKLVNKRGRVTQEEISEVLKAGYTNSHILGIITAVGVKTISNYMNEIIQTPVDEAFQHRAWSVE